MTKRYAKDFDPATPVIELCRYSNAVERIAELEQALGWMSDFALMDKAEPLPPEVTNAAEFQAWIKSQ
jgi:hypothetical protein